MKDLEEYEDLNNWRAFRPVNVVFSFSQTNIQRFWLKQIEQGWIHPSGIFQYLVYKLKYKYLGYNT